MVQALGDQLLAGAALADDQHRPIERRGAARPFDRVEKGQALPDELIGPLHVRLVGDSHHRLARCFDIESAENRRFFDCSCIFDTLARNLKENSQQGANSARSAGMGIFSRTRDIFAANFTELLDRAEDPGRMIRMIIMEMEETLVEVRASAARSIADGKEMRRAIARLDELQHSWTEKAELALSKDREDLAKAALMERQKAVDMADGLRAEIGVIEETLKGYEAD